MTPDSHKLVAVARQAEQKRLEAWQREKAFIEKWRKEGPQMKKWKWNREELYDRPGPR
jgi:hypothetical protein